MVSDLLSRSREQLGFFWRSLAPVPVVNMLMSIKLLQNDFSIYLNCLFVLAFLARYSIGNYNYVATTFGHAPGWLPLNVQECHVRTRFAFDAFLQGLQLSMFIWMGLAVQSPVWFRRGLIALLLTDLLLLVYDRYAWPEFLLWIGALRKARLHCRDLGTVNVTRDWPVRYTPRIWVINNLSAALALIFFDVVAQLYGINDRSIQTGAMTSLVLINSAVDIYITELDMSA